MKILALSKINTNCNLIPPGNQKSKKQLDNSGQNIGDKWLPVTDTIGLSIVFKAAPVQKAGLVYGENMNNLMQKIEATKSAIRILKNTASKVKPQDILNAEKIISKYEYWENNKDRLFKEASAAAQNASDAEEARHSGWANFWHNYGYDEYSRVMDEKFYSISRNYNVDINDYNHAKIRVEAYNNVQNATEQGRLAEIKALEEKLEALEGSINLWSIRDAVNEAMGHSGGLNDRIAGYDNVKSEIERTFVTPLIESVKSGNNNVHVPPAVMLYGATGCGKTAMLQAIKSQVKDYADVVDMSGSDDPNLLRRLDYYLKDAKEHYIKTLNESKNNRGKRTILLLNEAEAFLATNPEDMGASGMFFDRSDIKKLERYNDFADCTSIVNGFKSRLDYISKLPTEEDPTGCATTIFITSNYPHLIHRDLLSRDGDSGKIISYAVRPAANNDLREVMKYYFTKLSNLIEQVKYFAKQENGVDLVDSIVGISSKGKDVLKSKIRDNTIENMHIDPTFSDFKNFDMFIKGNNPSLYRGAYSNARIETIAKRAFVDYIENPTISYKEHYLRVKNQKGVDIGPAAYRQFERICDMVENPEKFKGNSAKEIGEQLREMISRYNDGEIPDKEMNNMLQEVEDIKSRYNTLKSLKTLSTAEEKVMSQYKEFLNSIKDVELPELI